MKQIAGDIAQILDKHMSKKRQANQLENLSFIGELFLKRGMIELLQHSSFYLRGGRKC